MPNIRLLCLFAFSLLGTALAAPIPKEAPKPLVYFPTHKGAKWVYQYDGGEVTHVVTAVEVKEGAKLVSVGKDDDGETLPVWTLRVSEKGLFQVTTGARDLDPPLCLLKLPPVKGEKWDVNQEQTGSAKMKGTVAVAGSEEVKVPAGTYTTVRVDWDYTLDGETQRRTYWYAPDVGLVKMKTRTNELLLKTFQPGKE